MMIGLCAGNVRPGGMAPPIGPSPPPMTQMANQMANMNINGTTDKLNQVVFLYCYFTESGLVKFYTVIV